MSFIDTYKDLRSLDVMEHAEKKDTGKVQLTYLSWTWAIDEVSKRFDFSYEIEFFEGKPYVYDTNTGYMVFTNVTIDGVTKRMWLPVMDERNNAMLDHEYTYKTKYGENKVASATMFEINKTIMRCLVKNLAMFGLGINIYAGEDLPFEDDRPKVYPYSDEVMTRDEAKMIYANEKIKSMAEVFLETEGATKIADLSPSKQKEFTTTIREAFKKETKLWQ